MAEFVDYKEFPLGDKNYWEVDRDLVQGGVGNEIGWNIEYKPVWANDEVNNILRIVDWKPKVTAYARGGRAKVVIADVGVNYVVKADKEGKEPVEKRGLYDLYIDNHIDIPDTISKDSPCYKQFMKELERK